MTNLERRLEVLEQEVSTPETSLAAILEKARLNPKTPKGKEELEARIAELQAAGHHKLAEANKRILNYKFAD